MDDTQHLLDALLPVNFLLAFGILAAIASRVLRLSPIVGYLALGLAYRVLGISVGPSEGTIQILAELGVLFLLFDIGLHFSFGQIRAHARDILGFGLAQVVAGTAALSAVALLAGIAAGPAVLVGATLALSSTAVVAQLIAARHQQGCPVGLTATSILIFQDIVAIFILIVAGSLETGDALLPSVLMALAKAGAAFGISMLLAAYVVKPVLHLIFRSQNEEVFTAIAILVALSAGWATGTIGLSVTLGAFLGGAMLADTPYRPIIQSEVKPFRGLLLGFFFFSVGLSLDVPTLARLWPFVLLVALALTLVKIATNAGASLLFRWSVPGSLQIAFLLSQGSEFALVIFNLPAVRHVVGVEAASVLIAAVTLTLAATPNVADLGRTIAGRLRALRTKRVEAELVPLELEGPVLIFGMNRQGRSVADALKDMGIAYAGIDEAPARFREALADGYKVYFGDLRDPRIWAALAMEGRKVLLLAEPNMEAVTQLAPVARRRFAELQTLAVVPDHLAAAELSALGLVPIVESGTGGRTQVARAVLQALGLPEAEIDAWEADKLQGADLAA